MYRQRVKPSKAVSKFGFFVGLAFCLFGLFMVIGSGMLTGSFIVIAFFLVWTGTAVFITFVHYKNGFTDEGIAMYEIESTDDNRDTNQGPTESVDFEEKLRKIERLRNENLITEEEYSKKREAILKEKW